MKNDVHRCSFRPFQRVAAIATALLAFGLSNVSAAVQQDFQWFVPQGANLQMDHLGNILTLIGTTLYKLDPLGNTIWSTPMPATSGGEAFLSTGCHIVVDAANDIYVDSFFDDRGVPSAVVVTKIGSNGQVQWGGPVVYAIGPVNASEHNSPGPMAFGNDISIYVVAHSGMLSAPNPQPTTLLRINTSNGVEINRRTVAATTDFTGGMGDTALAADSSGNVYYGGPQGLWSFSQNLQTQRWTQALMPRALAVDSANGALYVTGVGNPSGQSYNMFVKRLATSNGSTTWTSTFGNQTHAVAYPNTTFSFSDDRVFGGNKILLDGSGQVYAAGYGTDGSYNGGLIAKFNPATGARTWTQHYGASNVNASVMALTVDNLNDVYVSGQQTGFGQSNPVQAVREILSPINGSVLWQITSLNVFDETITYEYVDQVLVDGNGNTDWGTFSAFANGGGESAIFKFGGNAVPDGTYTLVGLNSGMALDDPGFSHTAGVQMDQWTVNNGTNQKWTLTNLGNNFVRLVNQASGLSLGVRGGSTTDGAAVEQNTWTGSTSQQWIVVSSGTLGYFNLVIVNGGRVLDVVGASKTAGALIDQWPSNGGANQKWHFQ